MMIGMGMPSSQSRMGIEILRMSVSGVPSPGALVTIPCWQGEAITLRLARSSSGLHYGENFLAGAYAPMPSSNSMVDPCIAFTRPSARNRIASAISLGGE
jgi:hypothetical protein